MRIKEVEATTKLVNKKGTIKLSSKRKTKIARGKSCMHIYTKNGKLKHTTKNNHDGTLTDKLSKHTFSTKPVDKEEAYERVAGVIEMNDQLKCFGVASGLDKDTISYASDLGGKLEIFTSVYSSAMKIITKKKKSKKKKHKTTAQYGEWC